MRTEQSIIHSTVDAKNVGPLKFTQVQRYRDLEKIGIYGLDKIIDAGFGMDTVQQPVTTASIPNSIQFLQNWLVGNISVITAAKKIDELIGISTVGNWEDEQIVQGLLENTGPAVPYGDLTNVPFQSWNLNFVTRTVIRFEAGLRIGRLEEARAARLRVNSAETKRASAALNLNIERNAVGFYGYNSGNNNTYGFLNDPNLSAYVQVATGASGQTTWASKTFLEICADIRTGAAALQNNSQDTINPEDIDTTLAVATISYQYLSVTSDYGYSVRQWIRDTYPRMRIVSAPQLNSANSSQNVFYLFADMVADGVSTDDMRTWLQVVPAKFQVVGVATGAKGYEEDYSNATAGAFLKRPYAVIRYFGI